MENSPSRQQEQPLLQQSLPAAALRPCNSRSHPALPETAERGRAGEPGQDARSTGARNAVHDTAASGGAWSSRTDVQTAPCPRGLRRSLRVTPAQLPERVQPEPLPETSPRVSRCQPVPSRKAPQASLQEETRLSDENSDVVMGDISF